MTKKFSYDSFKTLNKTAEYKSVSQYIPSSSVNINNNVTNVTHATHVTQDPAKKQ